MLILQRFIILFSDALDRAISQIFSELVSYYLKLKVTEGYCA